MLWEQEDAILWESERMIETETVTIEERPALDLAVVRIPENRTESRIHRFAFSQQSFCHPAAIHNATKCTRILLTCGRHAEFQYRYEGWVQLVSRKPPARVDLAPLAGELNLIESDGRWIFDGVDAITPRLHLDGKSESSIPVDVILRKLEEHLKTGPPAWDPHDR